MQMGMIGLGRMGGNMVRRLTRGGHTRVVYDAHRRVRWTLEAAIDEAVRIRSGRTTLGMRSPMSRELRDAS